MPLTDNATMSYQIRPGNRYPEGATAVADGVNFSIYSRHATHVELLLFAAADSVEPFQIIPLEARLQRMFFFWSVLVVDLPAGTHYAWRIDGPDDLHQSGFRFDREKVLLDPWARGVTDTLWQRAAAEAPGSNMATSMRGVVQSGEYDWEDDEPLGCIRPEKTIIYEMHVGGFTRHPSAGASRPGTFLGVIEKIPYLMELGVTHVELLPVMAFDEQDVPAGRGGTGSAQLLGIQHPQLFQSAPRLLCLATCRCPCPRVPGHGEGAA